MEKRWKFSVARWEFTVRFEMACAIGLGFECRLLSWRRHYPWLHGYVGAGPLALVVDVTRPDDIAREMRGDWLKRELKRMDAMPSVSSTKTH